MSSVTVSCEESTDNKARFRLDLRLNKLHKLEQWISEVFKIFCNNVAFQIRLTWPGRYMEIFTQIKSLNGSTCLLEVNAYHKLNILQTDLYTWQLVAEHKDSYRLYHENGCHVNINLCLCDINPYKKLYQDEDFTDFELYAENNVESVHVHRNVLAFSSPVLKSMLLGDWKEAKQGYVKPPGVTKTTLQHFKDYLYLSQLPNEPLDCAKLITIASYYMLVDLPKLEQRCAEKIPEKFKPENAWEWFEYCVQHKNTKLLLLRLRHSTTNFVIRNLEIHFGLKNDQDKGVLVKENFNITFHDLYSDTDFTNFELRVEAEDGISFHKNVLAALSPVLKTLLLGDWKEVKEGYVQLPNVSKATLQQFKDYLYLKKLPEDSMDCAKLFSLASYYEMPELEIIAIKIAKYFKPENAWEWIEYCVQNRAECLLVAILKNIVDENKMESLEKYFSKN